MPKRQRTHTIAFDVVTRSFFRQALGLMFSARPEILLMDFGCERRVTIHMFFVFFPLDVVFLDDDGRVIELVSLPPFSWHRAKHFAHYVLELPRGAIENQGIAVGDRIIIPKRF